MDTKQQRKYSEKKVYQYENFSTGRRRGGDGDGGGKAGVLCKLQADLGPCE